MISNKKKKKRYLVHREYYGASDFRENYFSKSCTTFVVCAPPCFFGRFSRPEDSWKIHRKFTPEGVSNLLRLMYPLLCGNMMTVFISIGDQNRLYFFGEPVVYAKLLHIGPRFCRSPLRFRVGFVDFLMGCIRCTVRSGWELYTVLHGC